MFAHNSIRMYQPGRPSLEMAALHVRTEVAVFEPLPTMATKHLFVLHGRPEAMTELLPTREGCWSIRRKHRRCTQRGASVSQTQRQEPQ
jgi:hypothetical protein